MSKPMSLPNFISANSSKDGAGFAEAARLIAGESPPQWLARHLQRWSSCVMLDGSVHAKQLGKAEARERLKKLIDAVELTNREIQESVILELLLAEKFGPMPTTTSIDGVLREIRHRAELASSALSLLGTGIDERLEHLGDGAGLLVRELQDLEVSEFLKAEQTEPPPENMPFGTALLEIKRQAESALLSDYLATKAGKTKAGRGRALPPTASSPRSFCAAIILEAWAYFHKGEYPGATSAYLAAAAEEYWRACGGTTTPWLKDETDTKTLAAWGPYFREAAEPSSAKIRKEIRRHVIESSAHNF